ncbi:bifunctional molybdopterin-guanine dinucleotide biosynthesis adaptor protein MobB/molybdopterin molybdotransferase MoeA [Shewanella intestini]|uniref:Molybdopterin molybdenumtransferase n=1 Tax=Shewanella intestini TaxID=2017544 RepID=A0ABS5I3P0_9GAMM|nr:MULTISPECIES: bifunctional molybdopterin-guanine dinucleotide biosynthesis adaptor protein MobB/molybdopterin molybdotransferase MoeA [Shewanella]MBR9728636.1 bifunctional molybdopterin-guanine dinucleotide biosynthesis adaptor protein MobB/molybdopterin molybdotransferase MoeA [Shewanella intestini]MRG37308.1 bifunctional molybdopterin-guanine dinucleotide biosynthesis adaptor protein MobB/molybdopterin molybdotransferase MoeA [Shewanella sp. XMDDZSB0408]
MSIVFSNPLSVPVLGFCAYSGTGKTTLLKQLIPELNRRGVRLAVIKHAHHNFDVDIPGKDSYEMRKAGAKQMLVASHVRWALMTEDAVENDPKLDHLLRQIETDTIDIVLVEGFKKLSLPKIELHRAAHGKPLIYTHDDDIVAIACCDDTQTPPELTRLDLNNVSQIADFVIEYQKNWQPAPAQLPINVPAQVDSQNNQQALSVSQGITYVLDQVTASTKTTMCQLDDLANRVLATDLISPVNVPQQTNSAMDGYAFAYASTSHATLNVVGEVLAGHGYDKTLQAGEAVRIMTGAPVPAGADTIQPRELTTEENNQLTLTDVDAIKAGQHVRLAGEDIAKDAVALQAGTRMGAAEVGLMASLGLSQAQVVKRPTIAVFSTGDEVSQPGEALQSNCIYDSNRYTIKTMAKKLGCEVIDLGIIEDDEASLMQALDSASQQADIVISSGGVSVGNADYIKTALAKLGAINFWRINMRPGRPLAVGKINDALFFGLPGNPVAVMVSFLQFVQPALRKLAGETHWQPTFLPAVTDETLRSREGRTEFLRGVYHIGNDGKLHVKSTGAQGSGMLNSMVQGNCLIVIGEQPKSVVSGDTVFIQPFADVL